MNIRLSGVKEFDKALEAYKTKKLKGAEQELETTLIRANRTAKKLAPVNKKTGAGGRLRSSIQWKQDGLDGAIYTNVHYAAYQEFGTGNLVSVPDELKEIAEQFRGAGVRQVNLPPQPFMYPAVVLERTAFVNGMKNMLGDEEI